MSQGRSWLSTVGGRRYEPRRSNHYFRTSAQGGLRHGRHSAIDPAVLHSEPGVPPYLRGAYPLMYRSKPWRIFQLSGFGNPEDEGERIRFLLEQGETGFIMEHDRNTADHLYDVDHPDVVARHEDVGLVGAVILSVAGLRDRS